MEATERFKPLDLTEENVKKLFQECQKKPTTVHVYTPLVFGGKEEGYPERFILDKDILQSKEKEIRYLLGQLLIVHNDVKKDSILLSRITQKYSSVDDYDIWTKNPEMLNQLLHLSEFFGFCTHTYRWDNTVLVDINTENFTPTISPKDTKSFPRWWIRARKEWEA